MILAPVASHAVRCVPEDDARRPALLQVLYNRLLDFLFRTIHGRLVLGDVAVELFLAVVSECGAVFADFRFDGLPVTFAHVVLQLNAKKAALGDHFTQHATDWNVTCPASG